MGSGLLALQAQLVESEALRVALATVIFAAAISVLVAARMRETGEPVMSALVGPAKPEAVVVTGLGFVALVILYDRPLTIARLVGMFLVTVIGWWLTDRIAAHHRPPSEQR